MGERLKDFLKTTGVILGGYSLIYFSPQMFPSAFSPEIVEYFKTTSALDAFKEGLEPAIYLGVLVGAVSALLDPPSNRLRKSMRKSLEKKLGIK